MNVLGFNGFVFNAAAALVVDGQVVAAAPEERFTRVKHTGEFPEHAIRYCLSEGGLRPDDLDLVTFHWRPFHQLHRRLLQIAANLPDSIRFYDSHWHRWRNMVFAHRQFASRFPRRTKYPFLRIEHHLCHAASAFYPSQFEEAAVLTVDGSGEIASSTFGFGRNLDLSLFASTSFPHSLGYLYVAVTHYLGFTPDSDEFKVMALASYGEPEYYQAFKQVVGLLPEGQYALDLDYFNFQRDQRNPWVSQRFIDTFGPLRRKGEPLTQRHMNVAFALQRRLEDAVLHMARYLHARTSCKRLCYAGGTALNSVLNTRLLHETPFTDVFVQPAANDSGTPIGSALYAHHAIHRRPRRFAMASAALGPAYPDSDCEQALNAAGLSWEMCSDESIVRKTARLIADGKVVGWFQGRMETGPRALGHRSILADPRREDMKDILNAKVKHREAFRPFAPAVLVEAANEYFECDRPSPFMLFVHRIRPDKLQVIPAVAHVDGTARVQTVERTSSPVFYQLIDEFRRLTGVPVLVNTSFNVMGQPIVCTPRDAVSCFQSTEIDALVLNRFLVHK